MENRKEFDGIETEENYTTEYYYSIDDYYLSPNFYSVEDAYQDARHAKVFEGMTLSKLMFDKKTDSYYFYANNNVIQIYES